MACFGNYSDFGRNLTKITGTHRPREALQHRGELELISAGTKVESLTSRDVHYLNSGVGLAGKLNGSKVDMETMGKGGSEFFRIGERFDTTRLALPQLYDKGGPHAHPGGEIAVVIRGGYQDVDLEGRTIQTYTEGDVVFYQAGSTHRPVSDEGAEIVYVPFDGIVFGDDPKNLLTKLATREGLTSDAGFNYALQWMIPDTDEQEEFIEGILANHKIVHQSFEQT